MLEREDFTYKGMHIPCWRHEPRRRPKRTTIFLPGFETGGDMYEQLLEPFAQDRILVLGMYEGSHPISSLEKAVNLAMTFYRHMGKQVNLQRYDLMTYSFGSLLGSHLTADHGSDHPPPERLVLISPAVPGTGRRLLYYERKFLAMGTGLQMGGDGPAGAAFAFKHGAPFVWRILSNYRRCSRLLESINHAHLPPGAIDVPTLVLPSVDDEFFPLGESERWIREVCPRARVQPIQGSHSRILYDPAEAQHLIRDFYREAHA